jgi:hypothetical protein
LLWSAGGRLFGCVADLRTDGVDRSGRPGRARGFVIADDDGAGAALRQVARLITHGLPDGYIVPDPASQTGFTVTGRPLPLARFKAGGRSWPASDRQQRVSSFEEAGRWLVALADDGRQVLDEEGPLAIGSPLLNEETAELAGDYVLAAGPGLHTEAVRRNPKAAYNPAPPQRRVLPAVAGLVLAALTFVILLVLFR